MSLSWGQMVNPISVFVQVILPLALVWMVGFLGRRLLHLDPKPFSRAGIYLLSPALIFTSLMGSQITAEEGFRIIVVVFLLGGALWLLSFIQTKLLRLSQKDSSAFMLASIFMNTVNYGFPVVLLALGQSGLEWAVVFAVGHTVLSYTVGVYIAARGRSGGAREAAHQVLRIPMLYAVLLALILRAMGVSLDSGTLLGGLQIQLLPSLYNGVKLLAQGALPIFVLVLGMQLAGMNDRDTGAPRSFWPTVLAGSTRLIVSPALAWMLTRLVGLEALAARATILEASMPSAVNMTMLATEFETRPQFVTRVVVGTTLFSMITVTLLLSMWI